MTAGTSAISLRELLIDLAGLRRADGVTGAEDRDGTGGKEGVEAGNDAPWYLAGDEGWC